MTSDQKQLRLIGLSCFLIVGGGMLTAITYSLVFATGLAAIGGGMVLFLAAYWLY